MLKIVASAASRSLLSTETGGKTPQLFIADPELAHSDANVVNMQQERPQDPSIIQSALKNDNKEQINTPVKEQSKTKEGSLNVAEQKLEKQQTAEMNVTENLAGGKREQAFEGKDRSEFKDQSSVAQNGDKTKGSAMDLTGGENMDESIDEDSGSHVVNEEIIRITTDKGVDGRLEDDEL